MIPAPSLEPAPEHVAPPSRQGPPAAPKATEYIQNALDDAAKNASKDASQDTSKTKAHSGKKGKRGNPGDFSPQRLEWLSSWLPTLSQYFSQKDHRRRGSRTSDVHPYSRARTHHPTPNNLVPTTPPDSPEKSKQMREVEKKLIGWWTRARAKANETDKDIFQDVLQELRAPPDPPRRLQPAQYYMKLDDAQRKIAAEIELQGLTGKSPRELLGPRYAIATRLYADESDEVKNLVLKEVEAEYQDALDEHSHLCSTKPSRSAEERDSARSRLALVAQPLLDALQRIVGGELTLLAADVRLSNGVPDVRLSSYHAGYADETIPMYRKFPKASPRHYEQATKAFSGFVAEAYLAEHGQGLNPPTPNVSGNLSSASTEPGDSTTPNHANGTADVPAPTTTPTGSTPPNLEGSMPPQVRAAPAGSTPPPSEGSSPPRSPLSGKERGSPDGPVVAGPRGMGSAEGSGSAKSLTTNSQSTPALQVSLPKQASSKDMELFAGLKAKPGPYLVAAVLALRGVARSDRLAELRTKSGYEIQRENNIARNNQMLQDLGLTGKNGISLGTSTWSGSKSAFPKNKSAWKRARLEGSEWTREGDSSADDGDSSSNDESNSGQVPESTSVPAREGARKSTRTRKTPTSNNETWLESAKARLLLGTDGVNAVWSKAVGIWYENEAEAGFSEKRKTSAKKRPPQIAHWVQRARPASYKPAIADVADFGQAVREWWLDLNPGWRKGPIGELYRKDGNWDESGIASGINGIYNVFVCLRWWLDRLDGKPSEEWISMVGDVEWVCTEVKRFRDAKMDIDNEEDGSVTTGATAMERDQTTRGADMDEGEMESEVDGVVQRDADELGHEVDGPGTVRNGKQPEGAHDG
ncbi:hypothetical protein MKEN_00706000 [Mycena kentingensis (nom. inval.)]|nr:hypothetical protein MKEN_00706000 [Mycena kentingensis (nom. inval.)]